MGSLGAGNLLDGGFVDGEGGRDLLGGNWGRNHYRDVL